MELFAGKGKKSQLTSSHFPATAKLEISVVIENRRYNSANTLVEIQSAVNQRNKRELDEDVGAYSFHSDMSMMKWEGLPISGIITCRNIGRFPIFFMGSLPKYMMPHAIN